MRGRCSAALVLVVVWVCAAAVGCSLTTNLDGLSGGAPELEGGTIDGGIDATVAPEGATPEAGEVDAAFPQDSGMPAPVVFADSFDDATPLPRAWDSMAGLASPTLGMEADAPSPPGVLSIFENGPTAPETYLRRTIDTTGVTSALTCGLKMKAADLPDTNAASVIWMDFGSGRYVRLDIVTSRWKLYGQFPGQPDVGVSNPQAMIGAWIPMQIRAETSGRIVVGVGLDVRTVATAPFTFQTVRLDVGVRLSNPTTSTLDLKIDDVVCTAE